MFDNTNDINKFIVSDFSTNTCSPSTGIFTVMCYNVLCDKYATRQMYGYCPSWALEWDYRKKGILDEIRHYSADIISLQVSKITLNYFAFIFICIRYLAFGSCTIVQS